MGVRGCGRWWWEGVVGGGVGMGGGGRGLGGREGARSSREEEAAGRAQAESNRLRNKQSKRQFLRAFRQGQADVLTGAVGANVDFESSAFQGQLASNISQKDTALTEFAEADRLGTEVISRQNKASSARFASGFAGRVGSFASQFLTFGMPNVDDQGEWLKTG